MGKLSSSIDQIKASYDVVVVGSGYGGGVSASRLSRAGRSVCLLERGREFGDGDFPETLAKVLPEFQVDAPEGCLGSSLGLFDFRVNPEVSVLVGCGLGGTSLINANVALRPDVRVFSDGRWPKAIATDKDVLDVAYGLAERMLRPRPYPDSFPRLPKMEAQAESARAMGVKLHVTPINVTFEDGPNAAGVDQKACILCGNCVTGCNHRAKNTTAMTYLPDARANGAEIYCGVKVQHVEKQGDEWVVHYQLVASGAAAYSDAPTQFVRGRVVVLAAGTLGSTEILLRSRAMGLPLSGSLGKNFSGNGDMLAFAYNCDPEVNGIGQAGNTLPVPPVGPTITSAIDLRGHANVYEDVLVEEGAIPSAIATPTADALFALAKLKDLLHGPTAPPAHRSIGDAAAATQTYLIMSLDDDAGEIQLRDDRARIEWPNAGKEPDMRRGNADARAAARAIGGDYLLDPIWSKIAGRRLITVHPIGGCAMGDNAQVGVVDDKCRVFAGDSGTSIHEGLFVCDGSVIPSPLGVNPLWTISAVSERACHYLAEARGWNINYGERAEGGGRPTPASAVGLRFTESLAGFFQPGVTDDPEKGKAEGKVSGSSLELLLNVESHNLNEFLATPTHVAHLVGTAKAPQLSPEPLTITEGTLQLLVADAAQPGYRFVRYEMRLTDESGRAYWLSGVKRIGNDSPLSAWDDSTTMHVTLHGGGSAGSPVLGQGMVQTNHVGKLVSSIEPTNTSGLIEKISAKFRFARFFLGTEVETYLKGILHW